MGGAIDPKPTNKAAVNSGLASRKIINRRNTPSPAGQSAKTNLDHSHGHQFFRCKLSV
jgi:hypothetical protein